MGLSENTRRILASLNDNERDEDQGSESEQTDFDDFDDFNEGSQSEDGSELMAEWAMADDPELAMMHTHLKMEKYREGRDYIEQEIKRRLDRWERNPEGTAEACKGIRRTFAQRLGYGTKHLTREQWYDAVGQDDIPEPPSYPHIEESRISRFFKRVGNLGPRDQANRLEGWARCDPGGQITDNPLRHTAEKVAKYWRKYDPEGKMRSNPCNQRPVTPPERQLSLPKTPLAIRSKGRTPVRPPASSPIRVASPAQALSPTQQESKQSDIDTSPEVPTHNCEGTDYVLRGASFWIEVLM